MVEPDFSFTTQPASLARKKETALAPKGKLAIKLISARNLSAPSAASRPYVLVSFDQNEFVSREPIHEEGEEVTGIAVTREEGRVSAKSPSPILRTRVGDGESGVSNGGVASSIESGGSDASGSSTVNGDTPKVLSGPAGTLPSSGLGRSLDAYRSESEAAAAAGSVTASIPTSLPTISDGSTTPTAQNVFTSLSAHNPTWKHEVFLYVHSSSGLQRESTHPVILQRRHE